MSDFTFISFICLRNLVYIITCTTNISLNVNKIFNWKSSFIQRIDAFELWCWRRLLRVPWTARTSLEGMMLKLKFQYFGHLMWRVDLLEKTLMLGGIGGRRRRGLQRINGWMTSPTRWTWVWVNSGSWWWTGRPGVLWFMGLQRVRPDWVTDLIWWAEV